jgi:hypothetical protein
MKFSHFTLLIAKNFQGFALSLFCDLLHPGIASTCQLAFDFSILTKQVPAHFISKGG